MPAATDVARYLVHLATPDEDEGGDYLCHMRLQKLLYYVQGWYLAAAGKPMFPDRIEAWKFGPVVKPVYPVFKANRLVIPPSEGRESETLSPHEKAFIRAVWDSHKKYSATALPDRTHRETPWLEARGGLPADAACETEITPASLRAFFAPRAAELLGQRDKRIDPAAWQRAAAAIAGGGVKTTKEIRRELHDRRTGPGA